VSWQLDPRFEQHLRVEPLSAPGGILVRHVDGEAALLGERALGPGDLGSLDAVALADGELVGAALEGGDGPVFTYFYDGDTGECLRTVIAT
jgi:hypothetical protein